MNKKYTKAFLISAVAIIWGAIGYKIITGLTGDDDDYTTPNITPVTFNSAKTPVDTFGLLADYPDPFLTTSDSIPSYNIPVKNELPAGGSPLPATVVAAPVYKPDIKYNGFVYNPVSKKRIAILSINNQPYQAAEKEKIQELTIQKVSRTEVVCIYKNKRYSFPVVE